MPPPSPKKPRTDQNVEDDLLVVPSEQTLEATSNDVFSLIEGTAGNRVSAASTIQTLPLEANRSVSIILDDSIVPLVQGDLLPVVNEEQLICDVSSSLRTEGDSVSMSADECGGVVLEETFMNTDSTRTLSLNSPSRETSLPLDQTLFDSYGPSSFKEQVNVELSNYSITSHSVREHEGTIASKGNVAIEEGGDSGSDSQAESSELSDSLSDISSVSSADEDCKEESVALSECPEMSDDNLSDASSMNLSSSTNSHSDDEEERLLELGCGLDVHRSESSHKLYGNAHLTQEEGILKVLNLYADNKCTKKCLQDILSTICSMLPEDNTMPRSTYQLFKYVKNVGPLLSERKHYYCSSCLIYFGLEPLDQCAVCECDDNCGVFYEFDIGELVKFFFEHRNLADLIDSNPAFQQNYDDGCIYDITDGSVYKSLNLNRSKYDITLVLNTDGVRIRKSSQRELWLLMVMPVEVPQNSRNTFISIIGVWFGTKPPNMNTFLKPFCLKLRDIFQNKGVTWKHPDSGQLFSSQVIAPLFIADAPARAKIQNILNFNGRYGCNICEVKAVKAAPVPGKRRPRVYSQNFHAMLRNGGRMLLQGRRATDSGEIIKGVKGLSIMSILIYVDIALLFIPEFMHSVLLGVVKQLAFLWFDKAGPWSCKNHVLEINKFLNEIRPPDFIQRKPRDISALKFWKASEFQYWLLFYSLPALKHFLPELYYQHYMLLVRAVFTLLQTKISETQIEESEKLLQLFVQDMRELYGDREMTYNVHQLLHLGLSVRRWGPLHLTSAFAFEDINGIVSKTTHGTINLPQEIVNNIKIAQGIHILRRAHDTNNNMQSDADKRKESSVLGQRCMLNLTEEEKALLVSAGVMNANPIGFTKAVIRKSIFTSTMYKQLRTADYHVSWVQSDGTDEYGSIRFFIEHQNSLLVFIDKYVINHVDFLYHTETRKSIKHLLPFQRTTVSVVLRVESKLSMRKVLCVGNFICKQPNSFHQVM